MKYSIGVGGYIYASVASLREPVHEIGVGSRTRVDMVMEKQNRRSFYQSCTVFLIELPRQLYKVDSCIRTTPRRLLRGWR